MHIVNKVNMVLMPTSSSKFTGFFSHSLSNHCSFFAVVELPLCVDVFVIL